MSTMASRPHIHLNNIATVVRAWHKNSPHTHYTRPPSARSDSVLLHILLGARALVETLSGVSEFVSKTLVQIQNKLALQKGKLGRLQCVLYLPEF